MIRKNLISLFGLGLVASWLAAAELPRKAPEFAIKMVPSGETLLSAQKGKVVVLTFISTTCGHCQALTAVLNGIQRDYSAKGVQVLSAAFNPMANMYVPDFIRTYRPDYPLGWSTREAVLEYIQHSPIIQLYVPIVLLIDRKGNIREQHLGDDGFFTNQEKNLRGAVEALLRDTGVRSQKAAIPAARKKS